MSASSKDKALVRGEAPRRIYVSFKQDPLVTREVCFTGEVFFYRVDAEADAAGEVFVYELVRRTDSGKDGGR